MPVVFPALTLKNYAGTCGYAHPDQGIDLLASTPSVRSISGVQIHRYDFETLALLRSSMEQWAKEFPPDERGRGVQFHLVELAFDFLEDPEERDFFNNLPTSFNLPDETVDRLRDDARRLLRQSEDFQQLLDLRRPPRPPITEIRGRSFRCERRA